MTENGEKKKKIIIISPAEHPVDPVDAYAVDSLGDREFADRVWYALRSNNPERILKVYEECQKKGTTCLSGRCIEVFERLYPQKEDVIAEMIERTGYRCIELMQQNFDYETNLNNARACVKNLMIYDEKKSEELRRKLEEIIKNLNSKPPNLNR